MPRLRVASHGLGIRSASRCSTHRFMCDGRTPGVSTWQTRVVGPWTGHPQKLALEAVHAWRWEGGLLTTNVRLCVLGHSTVGLVYMPDGGVFIEPPGLSLAYMGTIDSGVHPLALELESNGRQLMIGTPLIPSTHLSVDHAPLNSVQTTRVPS
jgi:hypothetical protein